MALELDGNEVGFWCRILELRFECRSNEYRIYLYGSLLSIGEENPGIGRDDRVTPVARRCNELNLMVDSIFMQTFIGGIRSRSLTLSDP